MAASASSTSHTWDDAASSASEEPVRRLEIAWRKSTPGRRPDPLSFVGEGESGVRLALLRADLGLRWDAGEREGAERYRDLDLGDDAMVALVYEEFCLSEDHGQAPEPARFYARFPEIAPALKRVLEIHDLIGSGRASSTMSLGLSQGLATASPFPEKGETIGGFHLVEELGRGGFARVFLARERQLADRPVALKVARTGSREPQTLARLQHTHIVPVHSYRIDPATGLHLLCMPYFGRVTLAHVLADPAVKEAVSGAELVAALDRLDADGATTSSARPAGRMALATRSYARAVAWWGARLAEALQHAHDRGVLHRDIKPSNVLVTGDGMPMLLDFNLAHEPLDVSGEFPAALGGTVAYMSPEHLEALADGTSEGVDGRSDVYALGVVLFEAMGVRPFGPPPSAKSVPEALVRAAEERRSSVPRLRDVFPEVPLALNAVVAKCLAPDPDDRYATAGELAEDLQAVADDLPLPHAREPVTVRLAAKVRRHRRAMGATAVVLLALGVAGFVSLQARMAGDRLRDEVRYYYRQGEEALNEGRFGTAGAHYETAARLTGGNPDLADLHRKAERWARIARRNGQTAKHAEVFFRDAEFLWPALLGINGDRLTIATNLEAALKPFFVLENEDWTALDSLDTLKADRREQLVREVHELLFLGALAAAAAGPGEPKLWDKARELCDKALAIRASREASGPSGQADARSLPPAPWNALRTFVETRGVSRSSPPPPSTMTTSWEAYEWGRLLLLEDHGDPSRAVAWLSRAARQHGGRFWLAFDVAYQADRAGQLDLSLEHYNAAVDLRPEHPRARINRARLYRNRGLWSRALDDVQSALAADRDSHEARLELGVVQQSLGNLPAAASAYDRVIASPQAGILRYAARLNRAKLDLDRGQVAEARDALDALVRDRPDDLSARLARAILALRTGHPTAAEADLNLLLEKAPNSAEALGFRALARLSLGRPADAEADAAQAARLDPSPHRERLRTRTLLASGRFDDLRFDDPEEVRLLPAGGPALAASLRAAAEHLARVEPSEVVRCTRAAILAAMRDFEAAEAEATRAIKAAPSSPRAWLVRARVRLDRGDRRGAGEDVIHGLEHEPDDPRLVGLRARLRVESGDPAGALADLDRAALRCSGIALDRPRAEARTRLGLGRAALSDWNRLAQHDPSDPTAFLGRARAFACLGQWEQVLADLEHAADLAGDRPDVLAAIALTYTRCLPAHPERIGRIVGLARLAGVRPSY
ncbi:MAG: serine/threonine protein kinase [Planctomycetota bacterium]|nr:serine/threonine protein kinase [Planctomycetota bacterium]